MFADIVFNSGGFYVYKKMNNPQTENGYIKIATGKSENDVLTALVMADLTGSEYQVVLYIIRKTWGYKKKEDWISLSQFQFVTGKSKTWVIKTIQKLVDKRIVVKYSSSVKPKYSLNKKFYEWIGVVKYSSPVNSSSQRGEVQFTQGVKYSLHTKENITKENIQKGINKKKILDKMRADLLKDKIINH